MGWNPQCSREGGPGPTTPQRNIREKTTTGVLVTTPGHLARPHPPSSRKEWCCFPTDNPLFRLSLLPPLVPQLPPRPQKPGLSWSVTEVRQPGWAQDKHLQTLVLTIAPPEVTVCWGASCRPAGTQGPDSRALKCRRPELRAQPRSLHGAWGAAEQR